MEPWAIVANVVIMIIGIVFTILVLGFMMGGL